jgi:hypothetical protein
MSYLKNVHPYLHKTTAAESQLEEQVSFQAPPEGHQTVRLSQLKRKVIPQRESSIGESSEARALLSTL